MLIDDAIYAAKLSGRLIPARPVAAWSPEPRVFLMCPPLVEAIAAGQKDEDEKVRQRWAALEAAIGHFVEGGMITEKLMKQLEPYKFEHWELLSRRPKPSIRIFGRFAKPDVFVGTHMEYRNNLGSKWSREFEYNKLVCEDHWKAAGLPAPFHSPSGTYEHYITENAARRVGPT